MHIVSVCVCGKEDIAKLILLILLPVVFQIKKIN